MKAARDAAIAVASAGIASWWAWSPPGAAPDCPACTTDPVVACVPLASAAVAAYSITADLGDGSPIPFPDDLDPRYTEAGLEALLEEAPRRCGLTGLTVREVDCSEFPCLVRFDGQHTESLTGCDWWSERLPAAQVLSRGGAVADRAYGVLAAWPPCAAVGDAERARFEVRANDLRAAALAEWGLDEPDEDQLRAEEIARLRRGIAALADDPGATEFVDQLQRRLDELQPR